MKTKHYRLAAGVLALAVILAAGLAHAQNRDRNGGGPRPRGDRLQQGGRMQQGGRRETDGPGEGMQHRPGGPRGGDGEGAPFLRLIADDAIEVDVENNDDGVTVLVTSDEDEAVEKIQELLPDVAEHFADGPRPRGGRGGRGGRRPAEGKDDEDIAEGRRPRKVTAEYVERKDGGAIVLSSDDEEVVERLQEKTPERIEHMKQAAERMAGHMVLRRLAELRRASLRLLTNEDVTVEVDEIDDGATLTVTSDDDELVERIQKLLAKQAELIEKAREARADMPEPPEGEEAGGPRGRRDRDGDDDGPPRGRRDGGRRYRGEGPDLD